MAILSTVCMCVCALAVQSVRYKWQMVNVQIATHYIMPNEPCALHLDRTALPSLQRDPSPVNAFIHACLITWY